MKRIRFLPGVALVCLAVGSASASVVIGLSIEDQARLSKAVVIGQIVSLEAEDNAQNGLETAVSLLVGDVLKGDMKPGQTIVFHTRGGELNGEISQALGEAVVRPGQKVLVFIEEVDGRLYNLGLSMGVWDAAEDSSGRPVFTRALQEGLTVLGQGVVENGPLSYRDLASRISWTLRHPEFDNPILRETFGKGR